MHRREIGRVVRLQIQTSSLKVGPPKARFYDPSPISEVAWLDIDHDGASAVIGGERVIDVHNAAHPTSKNRSGINGVSVGFTSHYEWMRERFDAHLVNGLAGENILVETGSALTLDDIKAGLLIEGDDGRRVELSEFSVAHPCVEFSRFALNDRNAHPLAVSETLRFLDNGVRGYYAAVASREPLRVEPGDRVYVIDHA